MTEQHQGQPEPNRTEQQIREELEKEVDTGQQEKDATDEGMPEAPGAADQTAQQGHTPTV